MKIDLTHQAVLKKYLAFTKERAASIDFRAEEKIKRIDELAEVVFTARRNYKSRKPN